jgi:hypothetical protein
MRNVADKSWRENQNTHFVFNNYPAPPHPENRSVYEIMLKNIVEPTDDSIIWGMRFASWIHKATDIHSEYVIIIAFPLQRWSHERA